MIPFRDFLLEQAMRAEVLDEMGNVSSDITGVDKVIYISHGKGSRHGPRIKVYAGHPGNSEYTIITVSHEPRVIGQNRANLKTSTLEDIYDWIKINHDLLMKVWKLEGSFYDVRYVLDRIKKI
ncbi:MAG: hypothetical protein WCY93_07655 [Anaerolineaceae bacterium]